MAEKVELPELVARVERVSTVLQSLVADALAAVSDLLVAVAAYAEAREAERGEGL